MSEPVQFNYSSSANITFRGVIDVWDDREEWESMSADEQNELLTEALFQLVDVWDTKDDQ